MDQIYRLKESIVSYLTPPKRRHTIQPSTPSTSAQQALQSMSEPKGKEKTVLAGRIYKKRLSSIDTKRVGLRQQRRRFSPEDSYEGVEDEMEIYADLSNSEISPEDSVSQLNGEAKVNDTIEDEDVDEAVEGEEAEESDVAFEDESEISVEDKVEQFLDYQTEYEQRKRALEEINTGDWTQEEIDLFHKLSMRGFEPLMHTSWQIDFPTCPAILFTDDSKAIVINARSCANEASYLGVKALLALGNIGFRVRAMIESNRPQEPFIKREIERYIKWSEQDGGYHRLRSLPVICLVAGRPNQELDRITKSTTDQLEFLARKHRDYLALPPPGRINEQTGEVEMFRRKPPIVYGIIIAHWMAIFVTLDSSNPESKVKTIAHFDFSIREMDLWNAFAISIMVLTARDYTMQFTHEMEPEEPKVESDPDL